MTQQRACSANRGKQWFGTALLGILLLASLSLATLLVLASHVKLAGEECTPSGLRRNFSQYVAMRDRTRIAVDIWLPADYHTGERLPVLLRSTRYWRSVQATFQLRLRVLLQLQRPDALFASQDQYLSRRRFVLVIADIRGSGASEGNLLTQYSQDGIADLGDLGDWAATQPWSNGRVGSYGTSYEGDTAEMTAVKGNSAVRAEVPLYDDFDTMLGFARPGGVFDRAAIEPWSRWMYSLDRGDLCGLADATGLRCWFRRIFAGGVKQTDEDRTGKQLAAILARRNNPAVVQSILSRTFRDDKFLSDKGPFDAAQTEPYGLRMQIQASQVPLMVWCGWMDAGTSDGALNRYRNLSNPQVVIIGSYTHGGGHGTDPLLGNFDPPNPPPTEQWRIQADFLDGLLRRPVPTKIDSRIEYYTMGEGNWHTTTVWPPVDLKTQRFYLDVDHRLGNIASSGESTADSYRVDYSATSGQHSRWLTQLGGKYVNYGNRAAEDVKLLTYTGDPLPTDAEITGTPVLTLELASSAKDGVVHAYLEDISPDGRVTYLTEGVLRLINRKTVTASLPYEPLGPRHSYLRSDAMPMVPGQPERVAMGMFATSVLLRKGHRIRLALAGADRDNFELISEDEHPEWKVYRDDQLPSFIELPMKMH
jgi:putative CocE/NonD family hydrolase